MPRIIDAHSHYMPPEIAQNTTFYRVNWSDAERHLKLMDECGIERSILFYPTSDAHIKMGGSKEVCRIYNESIGDLVKKFPARFIGAAILPVDSEIGLRAELKRVRDLGLKMISIASSYEGQFLSDEKFYPIFEYAQKFKMPVHVHSQILDPIGEQRVKDPLLTPVLEYVFDISMCIGKMMMEGTFLKFPDVKFIFAHYGGVIPFVGERFDTVYQMLKKRNFVKDLTQNPSVYFKNLFFDTSGSASLASLLCALEVVDASHILFGSDFPANQNILTSLEMIQKSALADDQKSRILFSNAASLLNLL